MERLRVELGREGFDPVLVDADRRSTGERLARFEVLQESQLSSYTADASAGTSAPAGSASSARATALRVCATST